jgi:uncharacterized surface protein with fasciclin (FAS1) repeats
MKKFFILLLLATASAGLNSRSYAQSKALSSIGDESDYYKFASMVRSANMDATLAALGTYTVFAPDNLLFREMGSTKLDSLTGDPAKMAAFLKAHIVKGKFTTAEISKKLDLGKGKTTLTNLLGQPLKLTHTKDNKLLITGNNITPAHFLAFDMKDPKGVIHGIDNILVK